MASHNPKWQWKHERSGRQCFGMGTVSIRTEHAGRGAFSSNWAWHLWTQASGFDQQQHGLEGQGLNIFNFILHLLNSFIYPLIADFCSLKFLNWNSAGECKIESYDKHFTLLTVGICGCMWKISKKWLFFRLMNKYSAFAFLITQMSK